MKNSALIISDSSNFFEHYAKILTTYKFEVVKVDQFEQGMFSNQSIDLYLVDIENANIDQKYLLSHIQEKSPQSTIVFVGDKIPTNFSPKNATYLAHNNSIYFQSFLENLSNKLKHSEARAELAAMLIHDLRSPLHSMIAYAELLLNQTFFSW